MTDPTVLFGLGAVVIYIMLWGFVYWVIGGE